MFNTMEFRFCMLFPFDYLCFWITFFGETTQKLGEDFDEDSGGYLLILADIQWKKFRNSLFSMLRTMTLAGCYAAISSSLIIYIAYLFGFGGYHRGNSFYEKSHCKTVESWKRYVMGNKERLDVLMRMNIEMLQYVCNCVFVHRYRFPMYDRSVFRCLPLYEKQVILIKLEWFTNSRVYSCLWFLTRALK